MVLSPELKQMCESLQKNWDAKCAMGRDDTAGESAGRFGPLGGQFWAFQGSKGGYQRGKKLKSKWREKAFLLVLLQTTAESKIEGKGSSFWP